MSEIGTLKGLKVKPGDLVECVYGYLNAKKGERYLVNKNGDIKDFESGRTNMSQFRIISRAFNKPKLWRDMTPEEKGALLLAYHEGKVIEYHAHYLLTWVVIQGRPPWSDDYAYRVKPEPVIETVTLYGGGVKDMVWANCRRGEDLDTHRITFTLIDGTPDLLSIKMEKLG